MFGAAYFPVPRANKGSSGSTRQSRAQTQGQYPLELGTGVLCLEGNHPTDAAETRDPVVHFNDNYKGFSQNRCCRAHLGLARPAQSVKVGFAVCDEMARMPASPAEVEYLAYVILSVVHFLFGHLYSSVAPTPN